MTRLCAICLFTSSLAYLGSQFAYSAPSKNTYVGEADKYVTCGSAIKISHVESGAENFLDSGDRNYGSGSGQQLVTFKPNQSDHSSLWLVREAHDTPQCSAASRIPCNSVFRL